jgi:hypothetical protein
MSKKCLKESDYPSNSKESFGMWSLSLYSTGTPQCILMSDKKVKENTKDSLKAF